MSLPTALKPSNHFAFRRPNVRQVRLVSGIVLLVYAVQHIGNLVLGNISLAAMETALSVQRTIWRNPLGGFLLYASLTIHGGLGLYALYARRHFRPSLREAAQLALGLSIPFLMVAHTILSRLGSKLFGINVSYGAMAYEFGSASPVAGGRQLLLVLVVWIHGCLGLRQALSLSPVYPRLRAPLFAFAWLFPTLALLGAWQATRESRIAVLDAQHRSEIGWPERLGTPAQRATLGGITTQIQVALGLCLAAAIVGRLGRRYRDLNGGRIVIRFGDREVRAPRGLSVLEAALLHRIPMAHVCGGRGRCSTCRVRVLGDFSAAPPPSEIERAVLGRIHARPGVRLACQLRPAADLSVVPLLPPFVGIEAVRSPRPSQFGSERFLIPMFVDMRGSTELAERRMPFDTVFIINRFLQAVSGAALAAGGAPNQILGDGLLILFGLEAQPDEAARQAMDACWRIGEAIEALNAALASELTQAIRFGIGMHCGPAIVGEIGYERHTAFTAIGDVVNVASRLQDFSKTLGAEIVISEDVCLLSGFAFDSLPQTEVTARGRAGAIQVRYAISARQFKSVGGRDAAQDPQFTEI